MLARRSRRARWPGAAPRDQPLSASSSRSVLTSCFAVPLLAVGLLDGQPLLGRAPAASPRRCRGRAGGDCPRSSRASGSRRSWRPRPGSRGRARSRPRGAPSRSSALTPRPCAKLPYAVWPKPERHRDGVVADARDRRTPAPRCVPCGEVSSTISPSRTSSSRAVSGLTSTQECQVILVTGSAFSSSQGLLAPRPSCSIGVGIGQRRRTRRRPRRSAWCSSSRRRRAARATPRRRGRVAVDAAPLQRRVPEAGGIGLAQLAGQRLPAGLEVRLERRRIEPGQRAAGLLATWSRMSPVARVLNTGSITGCISPCTPARGRRSSQRSSA